MYNFGCFPILRIYEKIPTFQTILYEKWVFVGGVSVMKNLDD
tara:strand:+ start:4204 stop:4329 length:126 start_codon:yes stop_codon:yes gene_type:complete